MDVYIIVVIVTMFFQIRRTSSGNDYLRNLIFSFTPLFLFGALREDFGLDYSMYEDSYNLAHSVGKWWESNEHQEIGYLTFSRLMPTWRSLVILHSLIVCSSYIFLFYRYIPPKYSWLAFLLLFLCGDKTVFFMFSAIRNSLAISIFLFSVYLIEKRRLILYICSTLLAMSFHTTALLFMPIAYFIGIGNKMGYKQMFLWIIVTIILMFTPLDILLNRLRPFMNENFDRYDSYMDNALEMGDSRSTIVLISSLVLSLGLLYHIYNSLDEERNLTIAKLSIIFTCGSLLGSMNSRLIYYVGLLFSLALTTLMVKEKNYKLKVFFTTFSFIYLSYQFFYIFLAFQGTLVYSNYHCIFF